MAIVTNIQKINDYRKQLEELTKKPEFSVDERFVDLKAGNTFRFRLIYYENENPEVKRKGPFREIYIHSCKDEVTNKRFATVCPTSTLGKAGFKLCKICEVTSAFYKNSANNPADKELYDTHKRKFHGYAIVLVVNDPVNPSNNGHAKLLHYGKDIKKFLDKQIFGIVPASKNDDETDKKPVAAISADDIIGNDAFNLDKGHDLIIDVVKKGEYNDYSPSFAVKPTTVSIDITKLEEEIKALDFDGHFFVMGKDTPDSYYNACIATVRGGGTITNEANKVQTQQSELAAAAAAVTNAGQKAETTTSTPKAAERIDEMDAAELNSLVDELNKVESK